jgi:hypothetical protein
LIFWLVRDRRTPGGSLAIAGGVLRFITAAIACAVLAAPALRAATVPTFAGISWGAPRAQVLDAATAAGLKVTGTFGNDLELEGDVFGAAATVNALISRSAGLLKVQVRFAATERPTRTYATAVEHLTQLYGPTEPVELFKRPYARGDGREDEALLANKAMMIAAWGDERQPGQAAAVLQAGSQGVILQYESHGWKAESARRQRESTSSGPAFAMAAPAAATSVGP